MYRTWLKSKWVGVVELTVTQLQLKIHVNIAHLCRIDNFHLLRHVASDKVLQHITGNMSRFRTLDTMLAFGRDRVVTLRFTNIECVSLYVHSCVLSNW